MSKLSGNTLLIAIIIIGLVVMGVSGYLIFTSSTLTKQPSSTTSSLKGTSPPESLSVNQSMAPILAYKSGGTILEPGNIWINDAQKSSPRQLTTTNNILQIFSWSPDNQNILISTSITDFAVVNARTGSLTSLPITRNPAGDGISNIVWTSNNQIKYLDNHQLIQVNLSGQKQILATIPTEYQAVQYYLNQSANQVLFDNGYPNMPADQVNVFVYDFTQQPATQISQGGNAMALGWAGDQILYQQNHQLLISSVQPPNSRTLVNLNQWYILDLTVSPDQSKTFYTADNRNSQDEYANQLFVYEFSTNQAEYITQLDPGLFATDLNISSDGRYGSFNLAGMVKAPFILVNLNSKQYSGVCDHSCYFARWQN
jgi:dipeptidyl aminopeptidase/acylaminoacyl peptidase